MDRLRSISAALLRSIGVCETATQLFEKTFHGDVEFTHEAARRALDAGLNLVWLARRLLSQPRWLEFARAVAAAETERALAEREARFAFDRAASAIAIQPRHRPGETPIPRGGSRVALLELHRQRKQLRERLAAEAAEASRRRGEAVAAAAKERDAALAAAQSAYHDAVARAFVNVFAKAASIDENQRSRGVTP